MKYWQEFEKEVGKLMQLQGWNVTEESLIRSKKVDLIATKQYLPNSMHTIAIECKAYSNKLTKTNIESILTSYLPLIQNNDINELYIVSINGISPAAMAYCEGIKELTHSTFSQIEATILNFDLYIQGILSEYKTSGIDKFYVKQLVTVPIKSEQQISFFQYFDTWLKEENSKPLAILGGYGMGKSTLALKLAYNLSLQYQENSISRIPIIIKLGELSTEQSLEGLLGKHLTSDNPVSNYQFNIFMELNKRGRYVILLDGFDEMKKSMTWDDIKFNFQELFRLISKKSKIVIFGRPTLFLNDDEYSEIINNSGKIENRLGKIDNFHQFEEIFIQPFSKNKIVDYIEKYSKFLHTENNIIFPQERVNLFIKYLEKGNNPLISNLINRPVHLKMIIELISTIDYDYEDTRVSTLYFEFINYVTEREMQKRTRRRFSKLRRLNFISSFAWWIWNYNLGEGVHISKIDKKLFSPFIKHNDDFEDISRDLLTGSILEVKAHSKFYFPHRSFLEYLVAEELVKRIRTHKEINWNILLTPEIGIYLKEILKNSSDFILLLKSILEYRGTLDSWVIDLLIGLVNHPSDLFLNDYISPWSVVAFITGITKCKWKEVQNDDLIQIIKHKIYRHDIYYEESDNYKFLLLFLHLRIKNQLKKLDININQELFNYMKQKYKFLSKGELRFDGATVISGLNADYCFVTSWQKFIHKKEFLYNKVRITNKR